MLFNNFGISDYLLLIGTIVTICVAQYYRKYFLRVNPLPGPFPLPLVGNMHQVLLWHGGNFKAFYEYNYEKYGGMFEFYMETRIITLNRIEYAEKILRPIKTMRGVNTDAYDELGFKDKGLVFNNNYELWKLNRYFFTKAMLTPKFTQEAIDLTNKLFAELESYWDKLYLKEEIIQENKNVVDFAKWFNQFTNDVIITLLTGKRSYAMAAYFNTQSGEKAAHPQELLDDSVQLFTAFRKYLLNFQMYRSLSPFLRNYAPYFKNKSRDFLQNLGYINQRLDEIIKRRKQEIESTPLDKPLPHDMLTSVITANTSRDVSDTTKGEDIRPLTDLEIRSNLFEGFLAGTDTTANTVLFIVYYLAHNPDVKKKLLEEIDRIFQGDKMRPITENDFNNLKYCDAITKEVYRLLPVINGVMRVNDKPVEVAGYKWEAGTTFRVGAVVIHKNKDYWVDPEKFNPDRWLVEGFEPMKNSFLMFGGGLKICPGRKLATVELVCLITSMFRKYEINLVDMESPLKAKTTTITTCTELLVKIRPRN